MKQMPVGQFKRDFSDLLQKVQDGEEYVVTFGKRKTKVAVLVSYEKFQKKQNDKPRRPLGFLKGKAKVKFKGDFNISDEEFLGL